MTPAAGLHAGAARRVVIMGLGAVTPLGRTVRDAFGFPSPVVLGSCPLVLRLRQAPAGAAPPSDAH